MHVKKGDMVKVLAGKDKGKSGKILRAYPKDDRVLVEGINMKKVTQKGKGEKKGTIIEKAFSVHVSNVRKETGNKN